MPKNIVICCDGTANQYGAKNTSIVTLYSALDRSPARQATFYDPGVGTFAAQPRLTRTGTTILKGLGLAFGHGLKENVLDAYAFLMKWYEPEDKIFMFGFSRGAYTVRVLAGMLHKVGLLHRDNEHLMPYADRVYRNEASQEVSAGFKSTFARECSIHFLGLFDTVSSVGWVWDPQSRPYTRTNPSVSIVRHAISIDEHRAFFRQNLWAEPRGSQDVKQVWFAGYHHDVGGWAPLHPVALEWILVEAAEAGLLFDRDLAIAALAGLDYNATTQDSLSGLWLIGEWFPKLRWDSKTRRRRPHLNRSQPRRVPDGATVHETVRLRMEEGSYNPVNVPRDTKIEPWVRLSC